MQSQHGIQSQNQSHAPSSQPPHVLSKSLPAPTLTFTLPSHGDGTLLSCRVFHPRSLTDPLDPTVKLPWSAQKRAAVLAHPYAPLGGCQDDHVIDVVGGLLLEEGFVVGTFDFRGAGSSQGKTSWTAKREGEDYVSFTGFMLYYMHFLETGIPSAQEKEGEQDHSSADERKEREAKPWLLMGGYSFGAIVLTMIPPLGDIAKMFSSPPADSHLAQIRLRAEALGHQQTEFIAAIAAQQQRESGHSRNRSDTSTRIGGDEITEGPRPKTRPRSHSKVPKTLHETEEKMRNRVNHLLHRSKDKLVLETPTSQLPAITDMETQDASYLLISRPQGLVAHLATMSLLPSSLARPRRSADEENAELKLVQKPTLLVFGDEDGFAALGKQREYISRLEHLSPESRFSGREITGAGHFWVEVGALAHLRSTISEFLAGIAGSGHIINND